MVLFGIHIGHSTACIAIHKDDGTVEVLRNQFGERVMSADVIFNTDGLISATEHKVSSYEVTMRTVRHVKALLTFPIAETTIETYNDSSYVKYSSNGLAIPLESGERYIYKPHQVVRLIFQKLLDTAAAAAPELRKWHCIISVPVEWSRRERMFYKEAALYAGWKVVHEVTAPEAVLTAYSIGWTPETCDKIVLVFRAGGVNCESTILRMKTNSWNHEILSHASNSIAGAKILNAFGQYVSNIFRDQFDLDPMGPLGSQYTRWTIEYIAEHILHPLASLPSRTLFPNGPGNACRFNPTVTASTLDSIISPFRSAFTGVVQSSLAMANVAAKDVKHVVFVGGATRLKRIRHTVASMFCAQVHYSLPPDEVIAIGTASIAKYVPLDLADIDTDEEDFNYNIPQSEENGLDATVKGPT